jgi:hypothetical protein
VLEVEGPAYAASLPTTADDPASAQTVTATRFAAADSAPAEVKGERAATSTTPRETRTYETRTYKGAVYEKREDGQWHLQKN